MQHLLADPDAELIEEIGPQARLAIVDSTSFIERDQHVVIDVARVIILCGPIKCSRGTVVKAVTTARELTLAVKRNSSAYQCRAFLMELLAIRPPRAGTQTVDTETSRFMQGLACAAWQYASHRRFHTAHTLPSDKQLTPTRSRQGSKAHARDAGAGEVSLDR